MSYISVGNEDMTINESAFESPDPGASFDFYVVNLRPDVHPLGRPEIGRILQFSISKTINRPDVPGRYPAVPASTKISY